MPNPIRRISDLRLSCTGGFLKGHVVFSVHEPLAAHVARDVAIEKAAGQTMRWLFNRLQQRVDEWLYVIAVKPLIDGAKVIGAFLAVAACLAILLYFGTHTARRAA